MDEMPADLLWTEAMEKGSFVEDRLESRPSVAALIADDESDGEVRIPTGVIQMQRHRRLRSLAFAAGGVCLVAVVIAAACSSAAISASTETRENGRGASVAQAQVAALVTALEGDAVRVCGPTEEDIDFEYVGPWYDHLDHIASVEECCDKCREEPKCDGFTWVRDAKLLDGNPGQCWRKSGKMSGKKAKPGVISGFREAADSAKHIQAHEAAKAQQKAEHPDAVVADGAKDNFDQPLVPAVEDTKYAGCAAHGEGCLESKCCKDPGHQCYTKNDYWAQCMTECHTGPNPLDQVSGLPWACNALGERHPGEAPKCAKGPEDCSQSKCCEEAGMRCFQKNSSYAQCKVSCEPGPDLSADDWLPWTCDALGDKTLGAAPWVAQCSKGGADCSTSQCCAELGMQCYLQSQYWGECKASCEPGKPSYPGGQPWACTPVGSRTPAVADADSSDKQVVGKWVGERCSWPRESCADSQCCLEVGAQCYTKDKTWATCKTSCSTSPDTNDGNKTWDCEPLGPKSYGLATKGWPSLFCVSLFMPSRYEGPLLKAHLQANAGIFACDGYDVFAAENATLGKAQDGTLVKALIIPKIDVGVSQDGTAGNAKLFMAFWDVVIAAGRFRFYDWTIKVDPDAVIIPWRVRSHMKPHTGKNAYVVNCNKFPGSPNFPMMFGAVEIFSYAAMTAYAMGSWKCGSQLPWGPWGEDFYMTHCLDYLGVGRINDFGVLGDNVCTGANCADTFVGSFHPFKDAGAWFKCWGQATGR